MAKGHEFNTAFIIWYRTLKWLVLPIGLKDAPTIFQKLLNSGFSYMLDKSLFVYLDNLLV